MMRCCRRCHVFYKPAERRASHGRCLVCKRSRYLARVTTKPLLPSAWNPFRVGGDA
jgi:hypothetical protein